MKLRRPARRGMTLVETTLVLAVACMFLFGALEYCRFLYTLHLVENAARDGARYAVVNMDKSAGFATADYTDGSGTLFVSIQKYTTARLAGADRQLAGCQIAVYAVDPTGLAQTSPVVRPKSANPPAYPDPFNAADKNAVPWNQATFAEGIAVTVKGTYTPMLPTLLFMPPSIPLTITSIAGAEG